jgi:glycosyltransferase involved in cell wall biosynthesis
LLHEEFVRCFGASQFDHVVDFSGYAPFWVKILAARTSGSLSIWLHNDLQAEMNNSGRTGNLRASVRGVLALCREADHLVSVSAALADVNRKQLAAYAPPEKFTFARNTINHERVRHLALGITSITDEDEIEAPDAAPGEPLELADLRGSIETLMAHHGVSNVRDEVERRATIQELVPPARGVRTFVTAGRLSPEKNHERLIRAFDRVHQEDTATRLVILGAGPLRQRLDDVVEKLGLTGAVTLAGFQPNPYAVLANSDCFVLSSDYEGQPMVLLEALVLGVPVVTTSFGSVGGALPEGYGLVTKRSIDGLAEGMRAFLHGKVPAKPFDYVAYNHDATEEFYRAIGAA